MTELVWDESFVNNNKMRNAIIITCPFTEKNELSPLDYYSLKNQKIIMDAMKSLVINPCIDRIYFCNLSQCEQEKILSKVHILKVDHAEAEALTNTKDVQEAAEILIKLGPKEVLISHEEGLSLYTNDDSYFFPWKYKQVKGRTGRGDTAFITYIGSRISKNCEESLKFSAALTSIKIENPGPFTLPLNTVEDLIKKEY